jgi:mono/diheme cytochrome c family protein
MLCPGNIFARIAARFIVLVLGCCAAGTGLSQPAPNSTNAPGLAVTFTGPRPGKASAADIAVAPNVWLYVSAGQSPTPFLPGGKFSATWNGFVSVDLRSECQFQAELNGDLILEINGQTALEASAKGAATPLSKTIRLNKGTNAFTVRFTSPAQGDAFMRLSWLGEETALGPIPLPALTHAETPEEKQAAKLRFGRELVIEHRCLKCHSNPAPAAAIPELSMDAPAFEGLGARRRFGWLARWIENPKALRSTARMPRLFHDAQAVENASATAAFLASLRTTVADAPKDPPADLAQPGKKLFDTLHCGACHNSPGEVDPRKMSLNHVREKFAPGALAAFLRKPEAQYAWIRMPNLKLSEEEANQLAAYLGANADPVNDAKGPMDLATIERGKKLVQTSGCLSCHSLTLDNRFGARSLAEIPAPWNQGCLAEKPAGDSKAPSFTLTPLEREALQLFASTDRASLTRHVPAEFADRQTRGLNCRECHGKFDGFPPLELLGGKFKPEWSKSFIAGEISYKPRPWIEARMPAFAARAPWLAEGLAMQHGFPPQTPAEPAIDLDAARIGQKLVSADGGFSCVSCHSVGSFGATAVFEAPGINLAYSSERLLPAYFSRWVNSPQQTDPQTKMPVYFEKGKSALTEFYDGDAGQQIHALWQYLRLGERMPPPGETK